MSQGRGDPHEKLLSEDEKEGVAFVRNLYVSHYFIDHTLFNKEKID